MKNVRPCHSIHCRHYGLADGMKCEVEHARDLQRALPPLAPSVVDVATVTEYGLTQKLSAAIRCF